MSFAIFVSETASVLSAPDASTMPSRAAVASNRSSGAEIGRPVSSLSTARTRSANSGCVFRPVPVAVPPSGIRPRRGGGGDLVGLLAIEQAEGGVDAGGGSLDAAEPARDLRGDRPSRHGEVRDRFRGLAAPELLLFLGRCHATECSGGRAVPAPTTP